jgi:hypothetical protein
MSETTGMKLSGKAHAWWAGVRRQEIADRAFAIYMRRSSTNQSGSSVDDWRRAERELWQEHLTGGAREGSAKAKD